jgi:hypothetical protein
MMKTLIQRAGLCVVALCAGIALSGCSSCGKGVAGPPQAYTLELDLDPGLAKDSVAADVVAITPGNLPRWQNYSMTKYWQSGDELRQDASKVTLFFGRGKEASQSITVSNAVWKDWLGRGVTHVAVVADLPGLFDDKPEPQDARRQILSLCKCAWPDHTTNLVVDIKRSGIEVRTVPRPGQ